MIGQLIALSASVLGIAATMALGSRKPCGWHLKIAALGASLLTNIVFGVWGLLPLNIYVIFLAARAIFEKRAATCGYFNKTK